MKYLFFFILNTPFCFQIFAQEKVIYKDVFFEINGKKVENVEYFLIKGDSAFLLKYANSKIEIPDTSINGLVNILVLYKRNRVTYYQYNYEKSPYLHFYLDNSLFNNKVNKKFGGYSKWGHIFRKRYLIEDGMGYVGIPAKQKKKYILIK